MSAEPAASTSLPRFLDGTGPIGALIAARRWEDTPLGAIAQWPGSLKTALALMLRSPTAMALMWGREGVVLYNAGYAEIAGPRHPSMLGVTAAESWPEVADFNAHVLRTVLDGGTLRYVDQELTVLRSGVPERAWFSVDYSPIPDEDGAPAGVLAVCVETTAEVQARAWAREGLERLQLMFEQSPGFAALLRGREHRFELVNPAYLQLVGHRPVVGKTVREALPDIAGQGYYELLDDVYATGRAFTGTALPVTLQPTPGGAVQQRYVDLVYQPIVDPAQNRVIGIFVQGADVTDRVLAERALEAEAARTREVADALARSEQRLRRAQRAGGIGAFTIELGDMRVHGSEEFLRIFGLDPASGPLHTTRFEALVLPEDVGLPLSRGGIAVDGGALDVEYRIRRADDGALRWIARKAEFEREDSGRPLRLVGIVQDVTERKAAQQALERSEARAARNLDRLWSSTNDLMATAAFDDAVLASINPAWTRLLGFEPAALLGRPLAELTDAEGQVLLARVLAQVRAGEPVREFELAMTPAGGGAPAWVAWAVDAVGDTLYMVGRNVTEQRAAEAALRQALKMEAVGQLTGGIAHDFNNLLQGITGSLALVRKLIERDRAAETERFIGNAMNSARRAAALTHRLLAFSRRQPLDPRPVEANPLMQSMEELLRRTLGEQIALEMDLAEPLWLTRCDPNQLENALLNLAINARDAMPEGGTLRLASANVEIAAGEAPADVAPGGYVRLAVADSGVGMTPAVAARAFEPFFTTKPMGQGTGLGLSMIYGFARQSGGAVSIASEPGRGTTVSLYLPRHEEPTQPLAAPELPAPAEGELHGARPRETLLVVEDEDAVRELIVAVLDELGYRTHSAVDGPGGLAALQRAGEPVDLLVTDVGLPGLNGRQLADAGRAMQPSLKVLFMTGYAETATTAAGFFLEPGMALITKPFAIEALAARIREMLDG